MELFDARDKMASFANKLGGKGTESDQNYRNCWISFNDVPNIHKVQASYKKLKTYVLDYFEGGSQSFYSVLGNSNWIKSISLILKLTMKMVRRLESGISVFVHCSDGWDRTAQVSALTQLILDGYYRTSRGFLALIDKEFSQAGHLFARRHNTFVREKGSQSPILLQFLDAVQNLVSHNPCCFEFSPNLLVDLAILSYCGVFANFICDNESQRSIQNARENGMDVWNFFGLKMKYYTNLNYDSTQGLGQLRVREVNLRFWKEFFFVYFESNQDFAEVPM